VNTVIAKAKEDVTLILFGFEKGGSNWECGLNPFNGDLGDESDERLFEFIAKFAPLNRALLFRLLFIISLLIMVASESGANPIIADPSAVHSKR
jgi:hypothetical protein